jgi:hypothetical protein
MGPPSYNGNGASQSAKPGFGPAALSQANHLQLVSPRPVSGMQATASSSNINQCKSCRTPLLGIKKGAVEKLRPLSSCWIF